jgi:glutamyl-tRNA synthetase
VKTLRFFTLAASLRDVSAFAEIIAILDSLDDRLAFRTFLVGHEPTTADWIVWGSLKGIVPGCSTFLRYRKFVV